MAVSPETKNQDQETPQPIASPPTPLTDQKDFMAASMLSFFLGWIGVDRFYMGYVGLGLLKLVTFGGCGIWYLIDLILILTNNLKDAQGRELKDRQKNLKTTYIIVGVAFFVLNVLPFLFYAFVFLIAAMSGGLSDHSSPSSDSFDYHHSRY